MTAAVRAKARWFPPESFYTTERCLRCGVCCGSTDGHPCEHLVPQSDGTCLCEIYAERLGPHRSVDGRKFICVPIKTVIENNGGYACCSYVREIRKIREAMGQETSDLGRMAMPEVLDVT